MTGLNDTLQIAAAGMRAQGDRLRVVAENLANADSTASTPGGTPYRRKIVMFQNVLDKQLGVDTVKVVKRTYDTSPFIKKYDPSHPAADAQGYVLYPNVNPIVEMMDMREARRGYEANLDMVTISKSMLSQTIALLQK
ncbi:MAG: flagellar basal body rod protein FlgC [Pseudomonadota bacterium]|nr:flagellar basal body rod protein FlgC [Pseudomonadota bacterium]MDE3038003.1 flagellar basal body rod protein FlgC [Pseudomonadota bacterium]